MTENMIYLNKTKTKKRNTFIGDGSASSAPAGTLYAQNDGAGMGKRAFPQTGFEVDYKKLTLQEFATKIGLTEKDMIDVLNDKRSYWPIDVIPEGCNLIPNNSLPFRAIHPGESLKEEIEYRKLNLTELAQQMGITDTELIEILDEKRPVTEDYAKKIEAADIGFTAELLRNMQAGYDIECVLIPMRNQWRIRKQQQKTATMQESKIGASQWQHRKQAVPTKQRVAVRTPATVGRELVPI